MTAITTIRIDHAALPDQIDRSRPDAVAAAIEERAHWRGAHATIRCGGKSKSTLSESSGGEPSVGMRSSHHCLPAFRGRSVKPK
jgi:hypothetical protein